MVILIVFSVFSFAQDFRPTVCEALLSRQLDKLSDPTLENTIKTQLKEIFVQPDGVESEFPKAEVGVSEKYKIGKTLTATRLKKIIESRRQKVLVIRGDQNIYQALAEIKDQYNNLFANFYLPQSESAYSKEDEGLAKLKLNLHTPLFLIPTVLNELVLHSSRLDAAGVGLTSWLIYRFLSIKKRNRNYSQIRSAPEIGYLDDQIANGALADLAASQIFYSSFEIDVPSAFERLVLNQWGNPESARREITRAYSASAKITDPIRLSMESELKRLSFVISILTDEVSGQHVLFIGAGSTVSTKTGSNFGGNGRDWLKSLSWKLNPQH